MTKTIPISKQNPELPPVPKALVDKANALYSYLQSTKDMMGDQLQAIYHYLDEFRPYLDQFITCGGKGCSHCCRMDVQLTTLEAEYLAISAKVPINHAPRALTTGHTDACPFLDGEGACGVYEVRPLVCRLYHAAGDPDDCQPGRKQIQYGAPPKFGNDIFFNLVNWLNQVVVLQSGGQWRDIRDFFPAAGVVRSGG
jgi:Fe-S-cluster containining protein